MNYKKLLAYPVLIGGLVFGSGQVLAQDSLEGKGSIRLSVIYKTFDELIEGVEQKLRKQGTELNEEALKSLREYKEVYVDGYLYRYRNLGIEIEEDCFRRSEIRSTLEEKARQFKKGLEKDGMEIDSEKWKEAIEITYNEIIKVLLDGNGYKPLCD